MPHACLLVLGATHSRRNVARPGRRERGNGKQDAPRARALEASGFFRKWLAPSARALRSTAVGVVRRAVVAVRHAVAVGIAPRAAVVRMALVEARVAVIAIRDA